METENMSQAICSITFLEHKYNLLKLLNVVWKFYWQKIILLSAIPSLTLKTTLSKMPSGIKTDLLIFTW